MCTFVLVAAYFGAVSAINRPCPIIIGASLTTINDYPSTSAILFSTPKRIVQICGGAIINKNNILSAAHCFIQGHDPRVFLIRVGSNTAKSGGTVHGIKAIFIHPGWDTRTIDYDVAILRTASTIAYSKTVKPAVIAGTDYWLADNEPVWAIGWGVITENGHVSEHLRHVMIWSVNRHTCQMRYKDKLNITNNMMCAGWLAVGSRDQCTRDSGSPLYHHGTVVGISSMGLGCVKPCHPGVNVEVSTVASWIQAVTNETKGETKLRQQPSLSITFSWD